MRSLSPSRTRRGMLPGFGLSTGFTVFYLCLVVLLPLSMVALKASTLSLSQAMGLIASPGPLPPTGFPSAQRPWER